MDEFWVTRVSLEPLDQTIDLVWGGVLPKWEACKSFHTAVLCTHPLGTKKSDSLIGLPDSAAYQPHPNDYLSTAQATFHLLPRSRYLRLQ